MFQFLQVAAALIPLAQALYANGDIGPARETCSRALKILQSVFGNNPTVEVTFICPPAMFFLCV